MRLDKIALVLEGGGMRGMFSAGVFEAFLLKELVFPYITAVSAGACTVLSYMSRQPLRNRKIIQNYVEDKRYYGLRNWVENGSIFGFDFIFNGLQDELPFDFLTYYNYPGSLQVCTTDIKTGADIWFSREAIGRNFTPIKASSSMPFVAPIWKVGGRDLMDGALVEPIPFRKAQEAGYEKFVFVLTRNEGYRKHKGVPQMLLKTVYKDYPKLWEIMKARPENYNRDLETVEMLERAGKAVIIRPEIPLNVDKFDLDADKLLALHDHGIGEGLEAYDKIMNLIRY